MRRRVERDRSNAIEPVVGDVRRDAGHQQHAAEQMDHRRSACSRGTRPSVPALQITSVEPIAISSQNTNTVTRSPASVTPIAAPA